MVHGQTALRAVSISVFRIQDKDGRGPFKPGFSMNWVDDDPRSRPTIFEDFGLDFLKHVRTGENVGCAFSNLSELRAWFSKLELVKLYRFGYRVCEVKVDRIVLRSDTQMLVASVKPFRSGCRKLTLAHIEERVPV